MRITTAARSVAVVATGLLTGLTAATPAHAANSPGRTDLMTSSGGTIRTIGTAYDATGDAVAMGDMTNDGAEEIVIANAGGSSENGRVDVLDAFGSTIKDFRTAYDARSDRLAVGDITNDGADEVLLANAGGSGEHVVSTCMISSARGSPASTLPTTATTRSLSVT
jgi:hypothetical protein